MKILKITIAIDRAKFYRGEVDSNAYILATFSQTLRRTFLEKLQGRIPTQFLLNSYVAEMKN